MKIDVRTVTMIIEKIYNNNTFSRNDNIEKKEKTIIPLYSKIKLLLPTNNQKLKKLIIRITKMEPLS